MESNGTNGGQQGDSASFERVVAGVFSSQGEAELAAASLEARGIRCWITTDDAGGMYPTLATATGVKLFVLSKDAAAAATLLDAQTMTGNLPSLPDSGEPTQSARPTAPSRKVSTGSLLIGVILGVLLCLLYQWGNKQGEREYRYDLNEDGRADEFWIYRDGLAKQLIRDRNHDGSWDEWADFDERGRYTNFRQDNNFDGVADQFGVFENGVGVSNRIDTDFNGIPDVTYIIKDELTRQAIWRPNNSTSVTLIEDYTNEVLYRTSRDLDGDGKFDEIILYDAFFNPISTNAFKLLSPASR